MIDDMAPLKQAMAQMDAEDPAVAQAAKDRAAQILSDAKLNFSKMAELIEQRQLLLRPMIVTRIKRMDQPGMLGDAAFRDAGSALRREGQSFLQIAEAIEHTGRLAPRYEDPVQNSAPLYQAAIEPDPPVWPSVLAVVANILLFPLRHRLRFLAIALLVLLSFYALRGFVALGQQVSGYFDGVTAVRQRADKAMSSVSSFVNEQILRHSKEEAAPPTPPAPIPSPPAAAPSPPSATASTPPATAPAPSANGSAPAAPSSAAPAPPSAAPAGPPVSTPRRDARGERPSKSTSHCGAAREDPWSCCCAPSGDGPPRTLEGDGRPRTLEDVIPERIRRNSRMGGPCVGGVGGCYWGGGQY
jgi:hypothetical protein